MDFKVKKIFITGLYGSGKTTLAKKLSKELDVPHVKYDSLHTYNNHKCTFDKIINILKDKGDFIIDAIPVSYGKFGYTWQKFNEYEKNNDIIIICTYCYDKEVWLQRLVSTKGKNIVKNRNGYISNYNAFYFNNTINQIVFKNVLYYDTIKNEYTSREIMNERISDGPL